MVALAMHPIIPVVRPALSASSGVASARAHILRFRVHSSYCLSPTRPAPSLQRWDGQDSPSPAPADALVQSLLTQEALLTPFKQRESHYTRLLAEHAAQVGRARAVVLACRLALAVPACVCHSRVYPCVYPCVHAYTCTALCPSPGSHAHTRMLCPSKHIFSFRLSSSCRVSPDAAGAHT